MRQIAALCVGILLFPLAAMAQPLADRVPADALVYFGWAGADSPGAAYETSHLKAVLAASGVPQLFKDVFPQLAAKAGGENPQAGMVMQLVSTVGPMLWRHPTAIYIGPMRTAKDGTPMPNVALLIDAGQDAPVLTAMAQVMIAGAPPATVQWTNYGNLIAITVGRDAAFDALLASKPDAAAPLSGRKDLVADLAGMGKDPIIAGFMDIDAIVKAVDASAGAGGEAVKAQWSRLRDAAGLSGVHRLVVAAGFDGKDWSNSGFIAATGTPRGLTAWLLGAKPVSDDVLKLVPADATEVSAATLDLGAFVGQIRDVAGAADPRAQAAFDGAFKSVSAMFGVDIRNDVLAVLGDQWVTYQTGTVKGGGGPVVINHLADPAKAARTLTIFAKSIVRLIPANVPALAAIWEIKDGNLYIGADDNAATSAVWFVTAGGKSILDNPDFVALRHRLGGGAPTSIDFDDLPKAVPAAYPDLLAATAKLNALAASQGISAPPAILPPLDQLTAQLGPAGAVSWLDDAGWHCRGISPFPGSTLLNGDPQALGEQGALLLNGMLLPPLNKARETANRVKCASNLRQIGMGCTLYSNEHRGNLPPDLGTLVREENLTAQNFVCPSGHTHVPADVAAGAPDAQAAWVNKHSDYIYLGAGKTIAMAADAVLAYERPDDHKGQGMNMLFGDGHVDFLDMTAARKVLADQGISSREP